MSSVELRKICKSFGDQEIVKGVDLTIPDGSFTVLLGPSGCGKTTTLNMISGLESVSAGAILFDGVEIQDLAPHKRDIAMVFQSYALYPNRTVEENISFALRLRKLPRAEIRQRVEEAAEMLGIAGLLGRRPRQLSGGQQQRVALARAIVRRPNVFLLDEPLSNLDAKLRAEMRIGLRELQRQVRGTFVYVTHDQSEAMSMADQVVVMNDGCVQQIAAPLELYRAPVNRFVAGFVGTPSMNFVDGSVAADGTFTSPDWVIPSAFAPTTPGPVTLGVRPESLTVRRDPAGPARVRLVERLGVEALAVLSAGDADLVARLDPDVALEPDDRVVLGIRPGKGHLFDPDSGALRTVPGRGLVSNDA